MTRRLRCRSACLALLVFAVAIFTVSLAGTPQEPSAAVSSAFATPTATVPAWAFPIPPGRAASLGALASRAGVPAAMRGRGVPDPTPRRVPNSTITYTAAETRDNFNIADWHPDEHPPMPTVVQYGRRPDVRACGYCHLANGFGKPENASLAGQPATYLIQQMHDFRDGLRLGSEPRVVGPSLMATIARAATEDEIRNAAEYFTSVTRKPWIRVIEADVVPVTRNTGVMYAVVDGGGTEPIGVRILEVAENYEATELRDGGSGFIAYVPAGSIRKGEALVRTGGNGRSVACATCHGLDMRGLGPMPSIAGRSPSYMGRQLYDFKSGSRHGPSAVLMKAVVANLDDEDIVNILAYLATLAP